MVCRRLVRLTGRLRQRRESSWSRLCSADSVGSIPPNVYFVLLRRTRIHRAPPSDVAEGGHARRDQRTPAAFSPPVRLTGRLCQVRKSCSVAVVADLLTQGAGGLRRFASPAFPQSTSSCYAELVSCGPLPLLVSADGHAPGPLATKASDIPLCFSPVSPPPVRCQQTLGQIATSSLAESSNPSDKALRVHGIWTETCILRGSAPLTLIFLH